MAEIAKGVKMTEKMADYISIEDTIDQIFTSWHVQDVIHHTALSIENGDDEDYEMSLEDARIVLWTLKDQHDCNYGICWDSIDVVVNHLRETGEIT